MIKGQKICSQRFQIKLTAKIYLFSHWAVHFTVAFLWRFCYLLVMFKSYDLIKKLEPKIGEEEAKELIEFIESCKGDVVTKTDIQLLKIDLERTKSELESKIENVRIDLIGKIGISKVDILKWLFGFWITLLGTIIFLWFSK